MKGLLKMPPDEKPLLRYPNVRNMVKTQVEKNTADFVVRAIKRQVEMEDLMWWGLAPAGELRPDTTPKENRRLGDTIWNLINSMTP